MRYRVPQKPDGGSAMETALIAICLLLLLALAVQTPEQGEPTQARDLPDRGFSSPRDRARLAVRALLRSVRDR